MARLARQLSGKKERRTGRHSGGRKEGRKGLRKVGTSLLVVGLLLDAQFPDFAHFFSIEVIYVDLVLRNPLDAELNLANLTLVVRDANESESENESDPLVDIDEIEDVILAPRELRTVSILSSEHTTGANIFGYQVSIAVTPQHSGTFYVPLAKYEFLSLLPVSETLSSRGRRLNATPAQRQQPIYSSDVLMKFDVAEATHRLGVSFVEDGRLRLVQGEKELMHLWLANLGSRPVGEIWMVLDPKDEIWVGDVVENEIGEGEEEGKEGCSESLSFVEVVRSSNSLSPPRPLRIPTPDGTLGPGDGISIPLTLHTEMLGDKQLCLFFVYREVRIVLLHDKV